MSILRVEIHFEVEYFSAFLLSEIANLSPSIIFSFFFLLLSPEKGCFNTVFFLLSPKKDCFNTVFFSVDSKISNL